MKFAVLLNPKICPEFDPFKPEQTNPAQFQFVPNKPEQLGSWSQLNYLIVGYTEISKIDFLSPSQVTDAAIDSLKSEQIKIQAEAQAKCNALQQKINDLLLLGN